MSATDVFELFKLTSRSFRNSTISWETTLMSASICTSSDGNLQLVTVRLLFESFEPADLTSAADCTES